MEKLFIRTMRDFENKGAHLEHSECRFRLCRFSLLFDGAGADSKVFESLFLRRRPDDMERFSDMIIPTREYLADGRVRAVLYLAREGTIDVFE